jgi:hypothetical protein
VPLPSSALLTNRNGQSSTARCVNVETSLMSKLGADESDSANAANVAAYGEADYIFGLHDEGGQQNMAARRGWLVLTDAVGRDKKNLRSGDYTEFTDAGYGVVARLNHGYRDEGTIPYEADYDAFAICAAYWVEHSPGAHIWIIGNETNSRDEWPKYGAAPENISPALYAQCFTVVRDKIKAVGSSHAVILQGVSPASTSEYPDPFAYYGDVLNLLGPGGVDGIALHTYSSGSDAASIEDMEFRKYQQFLRATPPWARFLPVYISETNQGGWEDRNTGWVAAAYRQIDAWNRIPANQTIRTVALYRWKPPLPGEKDYAISTRTNVIEDFKGAVANDYRWNSINLPHGRFFIQSAFGVKGNFESVVAAGSGGGPGSLLAH